MLFSLDKADTYENISVYTSLKIYNISGRENLK